jgi:hypothetical protein
MRLKWWIKRQHTYLGKARYFHFFVGCGLGVILHPEDPITGRLTTGLLGYLCLQENMKMFHKIRVAACSCPNLNHQN